MEDLDQERHAVVRDRWDVQDWEVAYDTVRGLPALERRVRELAVTAPNLLPDSHRLLMGAHPEFTPERELRPAYRVNRRIAEKLNEADAMPKLRSYTVGDTINAGVATANMAERLVALLTEVAAAQELADEAEEAQQAFEDACEEAGGSGEGGDDGEGQDGDGDGGEGDQPGEGDGEAQADADAQAQAALDALEQAAEEACAHLEEALNGLDPVIEHRVQQAAAEAAAEAEEAAECMANWGLDPGEVTQLDPAARMALAERLSTPRMLELSELFGRMRSELWAMQSRRFEHGPDEIVDIELGRNLDRLVGSELIALTDDDLFLEFLERYDEGRLMQYRLQSRAKENRGAVIYVRDSSGSMVWPTDTPDLFAAGFGLVLLDAAKRMNRGFKAIVFGGRGDWRVFDFGDDASKSTLDQMLDFAEYQINGGTEFMGPLGAARDIIEDEVERLGRSNADVVFATDGVYPISVEFAEYWNSERDRLGFRCFGITIGLNPFKAIEAVCDFVVPVHELLSGKPVASIFTKVTDNAGALASA